MNEYVINNSDRYCCVSLINCSVVGYFPGNDVGMVFHWAGLAGSKVHRAVLMTGYYVI